MFYERPLTGSGATNYSNEGPPNEITILHSSESVFEYLCMFVNDSPFMVL